MVLVRAAAAGGGVTCVDVMAAAMHGCSHQRESKQTGEDVQRPPPPPPTVSQLRLVLLLRYKELRGKKVPSFCLSHLLSFICQIL